MAKILLFVVILAGVLWAAVLKGNPADRLSILGAVALLPTALLCADLLKGGKKERI